MKTAIRHAKLVTMDDNFSYYPDGYITFTDDIITGTGDDKTYEPEIDTIEIDVEGDIVLPAFINLHTHLGMTAFRSLGDDMPDRLHKFLFPLENSCMTANLVYTSSKISMAEMLLSGTGTAMDMYYFEEQTIQAAKEMNMRIWAGETLLDTPHCDASGFTDGLIQTERLLKQADSLTNIVCAPHAPYSVSIDHLKQVQAFSRTNNIRWTMHVAEMAAENAQARTLHGCSPVGILENEELLDERLLAAHALYVDDADLPILSDRGSTIVHCPISNAKAAKGVARIADMIQKEILVTLGTDGPASGNTLDMFSQMKASVILQKNLLHDRSILPAAQILALATRNAGKALHAPIGILKQHYQADIQIISTHDINMIPVHDVYAAIVYSAQSHNVSKLWIAGKQIVSQHALCHASIPILANDFYLAAEKFNKHI